MTQRSNTPTSNSTRFRSPHLMGRNDTALILVDVQEKLVPAINQSERMTAKIAQLIRGAKILGIPVLASEQYPKGLGATIETLRQLIEAEPRGSTAIESVYFEKTMFSCRECDSMVTALSQLGVKNLCLVGIEAHVCVAQSAFDFISMGFNVFLPVDAIGSRNQQDHDTAARRLEIHGVTLTTAEAALFEWCETAKCPEFKQVSALVKNG